MSDQGCMGLGATVSDPPMIFSIGEPVDVGAHNECLIETLVPGDMEELYGVKIDFCYARSSGFACEGHRIDCPGQNGRLDVSLLLFGDVSPIGSVSARSYYVAITADARGECPAVSCEQAFEATVTRL